MRSSQVRNLVPALPENLADFLESPCLESLDLAFSKGFLKRFSRIPDLGDTYANGEPQKLVGLHQGTKGHAVEVFAFGQRDYDAVGVGTTRICHESRILPSCRWGLPESGKIQHARKRC